MKERYYGLDTLKFACAIGIVLHHYYILTGYELVNVFSYGSILTELFFMISGFLSMNSYSKIKEQDFSMFLINKLSRLFPMVVIATVFTTLTDLAYYIIVGEWFQEEVSLWNLLVSVTLQYGGGAAGNVAQGINNPLWFIGVLLVCEILAFFAVKVSSKHKFSINYIYVFMIIVGIIGVTYGNDSLPFYNFHMARGYYSFFLGGLIYNILAVKKDNRWLLYSVVAIILFAFPKIIGITELYSTWSLSIVFIVYPAIIAIATQSKYVNFIAKTIRADFWGGISFEIFIWHMSVYAMQGILIRKGILSGDSLISVIVICIISVSIAVIMYVFVEKKVNSWAKKEMTDFAKRVMY